MRDLPTIFKIVINILLYVFYVLVASIAFSFIFPLVMQLMGRGVLDPNNPIFTSIQLFIALLVLVISLIFRKSFYMWLENKTVTVTQSVEEKDWGLKIEIEKEIQ